MTTSVWLKSGWQLAPFTAFVAGILLWWGGTDFSVFELFTLVVAGVTLMHIVLNHDFKALLPRARRDYVVLGFVLLILLQVALADIVDGMFAAATVYLVTLYWLAKYWRETKPELIEKVVRGYFLGALVFSALGLLNYLLAVADIKWSWFVYEVRWRGLLDDPVVFGGLLVPAIVIFGYRAVFAAREPLYWRYLTLTLVCFGSLILTGSRGAWLNLVAAGLVIAVLEKSVWEGRQFSRALVLASLSLLIALTLIYVVPVNHTTYFNATLEHRFGASDAPRIENFQVAPERLFNRPLWNIILGSGSGSYEYFADNGFSAHNTYLRVLFEQGIIGITLLGLFLFWSLRSAWRGKDRHWAVLILAIMVGVMVQSLFVDTLHWRHFWLILALI